ncbi:Retrovirus-related Pol polyprotein from transposon 17.6 [Araneus ventricosus]|uniref:RNA-directed DNA polymerase n=1 Tax=Araneus ventricosus TaxID=182803 RepID=A0A4Y2APJ8_ARAVE|nr:Retrovirus-related Pol polyprotein from transposon 17.6 [Araneus ventricosus]
MAPPESNDIENEVVNDLALGKNQGDGSTPQQQINALPKMNVLSNASMMQMVPNLSGKNVIDFFRTLEYTGKLSGWNDEQLFIITNIKLEGNARKYFESSLQSPDINYKKLKECMLSHFTDSQSFSTDFAKFSSAKQYDMESVKDYSVRMEGLAHKSFVAHCANSEEKISDSFKEKLLLSQFISGLRQKIKAPVMIENPSTFSEAVEFATRVEKSQELLTPNVNVVEGYAQNNDFEKMLKTTTETYAKSLELVTQQLQALTSRLDILQNGTEQQRNFRPQVIICSYCSRPGHIAPNCYQKSRDRQGQINQNMRSDFNLRRQNQYHYGRQNQPIRQNQASVVGEARVDPLSFTEAHTDPKTCTEFSSCNLPIISVDIDKIKCNALIDTGATMNLLSIDMVQLLKHYKMLQTPPIELKTLSGTTVISNQVLECEIVLGNKTYKTQFVISNSCLSPAFEVILGFNFLNYFNFVIDCGENTIKNNDVCIKWNFERAYPYGFEYNIQHEMKPDNSLNENSNVLIDQNVKCKQTGKPPLGRVFTKTLIPPNSQKYVDIKIDDVNNNFVIGNIILLEKNPNLSTSSIMIARAVSTLKENNMCLALVLNLEDKPLTLNKGMIIVQALPIHEVSNIESVNTLSDGKNSKKIDWDKTLNFDHLSKEQKSKVINLLNKYNSVFAQDISELGQCGIVQHEIHLTDPVPTRQKPYRVPYQLKAEMKRQINTLLDAGIIQPSKSAYAAPVLLVKKSDDSYRLVADLRKLNSKTIPDNFPLPNLNEMIDMLTGAKYFTTMDLTSGFHQMLLHPNSTHLTGITTEFGLFEYKRLPFGLRNASSSFQRLMSLVLNGLSDLQIGCYIDDIIIASNDFDQHLARLELVFQRLITANLKVKPSKCAFLQFEISFLGHTVKEGKVLPDSKNLKSIKDSLPPNSKKKVRSFLGLTGFYRKFIPNYSKIALPLTNLTKDKVPFVWGEEEQKAFELLKNYLITEPCLHLPDFSRPFSIFTDASKYSLGCVLVQEDASTGFHHPIAFASRKLGPSEISYATVEKECLALVFAITHFKNYLYGAHFNVFSDQQCLSRVKTLKDPTSRIARWFLTLQQYDYTIIYKPGRLNFMADYLSRATYPTDKQSDNTNSEEIHNVNAQFNVFNFTSIHELIEKQNKDPYCQNIKSKLNSNFVFSPKSPQFFIKHMAPDIFLFT